MCEPIDIDQEDELCPEDEEDAEDALFCQEGECSCCEDSIDSEKAVPKWLVSDVIAASRAVLLRTHSEEELAQQRLMLLGKEGRDGVQDSPTESEPLFCYGPFSFEGEIERFSMHHSDHSNWLPAPRGTWDELVLLVKCREYVIDTRPTSTQLFHGQLTGTNDAETGTLTDTHAAQVYHDRYQAPRSNEGGIKAGPGGLRVSA